MAVEPHDGSSLPNILVPANPPSDDPVAQGDDHLRLLKIVVQNFYTAYLAELLAAQTRLTTLETLTASGSVGDANKLGGQLPAFYRDASNLNAGTVPSARLVGTYAFSISGNAATANSATHAADASTADYATSAGSATTADKVGTLSEADIRALQTVHTNTTGFVGNSGINSSLCTLSMLAMPACVAELSFMFGHNSGNLFTVTCTAMPSNTALCTRTQSESGYGNTLSTSVVRYIVNIPNGTTQLRFGVVTNAGHIVYFVLNQIMLKVLS